MTAPALASRLVGWDPADAALYVAPEAPTASVCDSVLLEAVALADRIVRGVDGMTADRAGWVTPSVPWTLPDGATIQAPEVGRALEGARLTGSDERTLMVLALAQVARTVGGPRPATREAGAGWIALAAGAVACVLVGAAVAWYVTSTSTQSLAVRQTHASILEAGRLQSERMATAARTGQPVAPPGPAELAAADAVRSYAQLARDAGIGQHLEAAASSLGKGLAILAGGWVLVKIMDSRKG